MNTKNLLKDYSLKSFYNQEEITYEQNVPYNLPNFFTQVNQKKDVYSEKSFQFHQRCNLTNNTNQHNFGKRLKSSNYMSLNTTKARKPLNQILKSNADNLLNDRMTISKGKNLSKRLFTQMDFQKLQSVSCKKSQSKDKQNNSVNQKDKFKQMYENNESLLRLKNDVKNIKTLQQEVKKSQSRSCSGKKKGLECTLYEKSLQKKINQSVVKSAKKLITIKKRFQKTESQWGTDKDAPQKDIKKILLIKKNKEQFHFNNTNCFNSVVLNKAKRMQQLSRQKGNYNLNAISRPISIPKPWVAQNIRSVSKNKKQAFSDLNKSMHLIKQTCRDHQFVKKSVSKQKPKQMFKTSVKKQTLQKQKQQKDEFLEGSKSKKIMLNDKIKLNLSKIHEKYKFILSYLTDFDLIGKMNGFELAGIEQCKWILLIIDDVYELIKHSQESKLKGIEYSRQYEFKTQKKQDISE